MENVKLDLIPGRVMPICHASQYDVGRVIRFNLVENDVPYVLDGTETVTFGERKIDGNVITAACTVTATKSYVDLETTEQMCACYGQNLCELKIEKGSDIIGTLNFVLDVERDPLEGGIQSESEIYNLQVQINEIIRQELENYDIYGAYVTEQISGAIANFTDGADNVPVKALSVEFSASQASGTPTPSAPIPIVGVDKVIFARTGKNLFSPQKAVIDSDVSTTYISDGWLYFKTGSNGLKYILQTNQQITISGIFKNESASSNVIRIRARYTDDTTMDVFSYTANDTDEHYLSGKTTSGKTVAYIYSAFTNSAVTLCKDVQLEIGSTSTTYEPYNGTTALINLGGTYYGGSVDAVTGKITNEYDKYVFDGTETWIQYASGVFYTLVLTSAKYADNQVVSCEKYLGKMSAAGNANYPDLSCWLQNSETYKRFYIKDTTLSSTTDAQNAMNGIKVKYPLATPIVVYASNTAEIPTILGVNNFFSDAGDVDVTYRADTALYIDKRLNA